MNVRPCNKLCSLENSTQPLVGAVVVSSTSVSFHLFRANSSDIIKLHRVPITNLLSTRDGWLEQDPIAIMRSVEECIDKTMAYEKVTNERVIAIGIANQRGTVLAWNKNTGVPLSNAILSSDIRTTRMVNEFLRKNDKYKFQNICGLPASSCFSAFKIKWLIKHDPVVLETCKQGHCYFGTIDTWLIWNLSGGPQAGNFVTDTTNAAFTFLMDIDKLQWDPTLLKYFGISSDALPKIKSSSEIYGMTNRELLKVPISSIIGDRQAALLGHKCFRAGDAKAILGTSGSVIVNTGENKIFSKNGLLTTIAFHCGPTMRPTYALEGPISCAGEGIDWVKKNFNTKSNKCDIYPEKYEKKRKNVYFVPALRGLFAPYWREDARCIIVGFDRNTRSEDIIKAAKESVCFQIKDIVGALEKDIKLPIRYLKLNGGVTNDRSLMQFQADILNVQICVPTINELTALGAAMMAGNAPGIDAWDIRCMPEIKNDIYAPKMRSDEQEIRYIDWSRSVVRSFGWVDIPIESKKYDWALTAGIILASGILIYLFISKKNLTVKLF
ncbi:glycerol kinase-like [Daktulosphaira vitifoliae]|uniref:glycerol kinase-like n=1 Tax=Daktulosphaira vitifoliae TaxID=58002 RepID=UPI0021AA3903|nr:glycerol kinase-like [Daktulosphaira vitifoliae]